ncbi:MAG: J domain-containing protein, partial [Clostridiales bacterium]|nr:J domain-containing protein [Clostridiales bacterium]
ILDLETSHVSIDEIKSAYRQAAKKYHPDLNVGDSLAEEKIKDINEAYKVLSVPSSKRKYDRMWNSKFGKGKKAFTSKSQKGVILDMFLGNIDNIEKAEQVKKVNPVKGENIETQINVSIYDAFYGLDKQIVLKTIEGDTKSYTVKIPKGIRSGEKVRLIGQGKPGKNGGKNGDLLIQINIENDSKFRLTGSEINTDLLLTPWEAALGVRTSVKSIDDETKVYVPEGVQSGEKIRIPNKGYYINKTDRGDLVAEVKVVVPKHISLEEKEMYKKLSKISKFNPRA